MTYHTMVSSIIVLPKEEPIFSEQATTIYLEDEAAGLFVVVKQCPAEGEQKVAFTHEEWPTIKDAIEQLMETCQHYDNQ